MLFNRGANRTCVGAKYPGFPTLALPFQGINYLVYAFMNDMTGTLAGGMSVSHAVGVESRRPRERSESSRVTRTCVFFEISLNALSNRNNRC